MEIGRANISLKEAKQVVEDPVKFSSVCPLTQTRREAGEILFGLSYLPTAQRLSFSVVKINSIKVDKKIGEETLSKLFSIVFIPRDRHCSCLIRSLRENSDVQPVRETDQEEEDDRAGQHQGSGLQRDSQL